MPKILKCSNFSRVWLEEQTIIMSKKKNEENHIESKYSTRTEHIGNCDPLCKQLGFDHPGKSYKHRLMIVLENQSLFRTLKFKQINQSHQGDQIQLL